MNGLELLLLALGLSMDAFAVSVCKGLSLGSIHWKHMALAGLWFGGFQALMPTAGYYLGTFFTDIITSYNYWIAFALLTLIGGNMIKESFEAEDCPDANMAAPAMFALAVATSIDALAVGVTFAFRRDEHRRLSRRRHLRLHERIHYTGRPVYRLRHLRLLRRRRKSRQPVRA